MNEFQRGRSYINDELRAAANSNDVEKLYFLLNNETKNSYYQFEKSINLKRIVIPPNISIIKASLFRSCRSLVQVLIPSTVTSVYNFSFSNCISMKEITLPSSSKSITYYAFNGCTSLKSITIPPTVTSIEDDAFINYSSLKKYYSSYGFKNN